MSVPQFVFGAGALFAAANGGQATQVAAVQGAQVTFQFAVKELYGRNAFPIAVPRGQGKVTGHVDFIGLHSALFTDIFLNTVAGPVPVQAIQGELQTVANGAATACQASNFVALQLVADANSGVPMELVLNAPAPWQFTCNAGVFGFNAAQNGANVTLSYTRAIAANSSVITQTNIFAQDGPAFMAVLTESFQGQQMTLVLNECVPTKLDLVSKLEDWMACSMDFECRADINGVVGSWSTDLASIIQMPVGQWGWSNDPPWSIGSPTLKTAILTALNVGGLPRFIYANTQMGGSNWKAYFELQNTDSSASSTPPGIVGFTSVGGGPDNFWGVDGNGTGGPTFNGTPLIFSPISGDNAPISNQSWVGQTVMFAIDFGAGVAWLGFNGAWCRRNPNTGLEPVYTGITGPILPIGNCQYSEPNTTTKLATHSTDLNYSPPPGFTAIEDLPYPTS